MDLVSIIVPVYNVEKYINKCIDSIINQTYSNLEIILIDDGSPDQCGEICDKYAVLDKRIKVIHKSNGGLSDARNMGLDAATGDYIVFIDSDDYVDLNMISVLHKRIIESKADMVICNYLKVNEEGLIIEEKKENIPDFDKVYTGIDILDCVIQYGGSCFVTVWNRMYKKELWQNIRFPVGKQHEDEYVLHEICLNCDKVSGINTPLYFYRQRNDSIMNMKYNVRRLDAIEALFMRANALYNMKEYNLANEFYIWAATGLGEAYNKLDRKQKINKLKLNYLLKLYRKNCFQFIKVAPSGKYILKYMFHYINPYYALKIIDRLSKLKINIILVKNLLVYILSIVNKKYILLDTPTHGNLGDHAITIAEEDFISKLDIGFSELVADKIDNHEKIYSKITPSDKIILIHGGGFIGDIWKNEEERLKRILSSFYRNKIIIFPQTVSFKVNTEKEQAFFNESKKIYSSHKNLELFVRERQSYNFMKNNMPNVKVEMVPDIVISFSPDIRPAVRKGIVLCFRKDREKLLTNSQINEVNQILKKKYEFADMRITDTVINKMIQPKDRQKEVYDKLKEFASAELVVTDRLHGMIFAAITNTPCIAFGNTSGKVKGVYEWIKDNDYIFYANSMSEFEKYLDCIDVNKTYRFNINNINKNFEPLRKAVRGE